MDVTDFKAHLRLSRLRGGYFESTPDDVLEKILNIASDIVADLTGDENQTGAKLKELDSSIIDHCILLCATELLESANPLVSEELKISKGRTSCNKEALSGFKQSAVYQKIQNLITQSGLRDVNNWVDV